MVSVNHMRTRGEGQRQWEIRKRASVRIISLSFACLSVRYRSSIVAESMVGAEFVYAGSHKGRICGLFAGIDRDDIHAEGLHARFLIFGHILARDSKLYRQNGANIMKPPLITFREGTQDKNRKSGLKTLFTYTIRVVLQSLVNIVQEPVEKSIVWHGVLNSAHFQTCDWAGGFLG